VVLPVRSRTMLRMAHSPPIGKFFHIIGRFTEYPFMDFCMRKSSQSRNHNAVKISYMYTNRHPATIYLFYLMALAAPNLPACNPFNATRNSYINYWGWCTTDTRRFNCHYDNSFARLELQPEFARRYGSHRIGSCFISYYC
jgi:hypothetical protein